MIKIHYHLALLVCFAANQIVTPSLAFLIHHQPSGTGITTGGRHSCVKFVGKRTLRYELSMSITNVANENNKQSEKQSPPLKVAVIGGGWAGFSAADALSPASNVQVTLFDASPRGRGGLAGGWRTPKLGRPVEAGIHGFWREYKNTFATMKRIGLDLDDVLTPYTPSVLVSESGKVAVAPVLGGEKEITNSRDETTFNAQQNICSNNFLQSLLPPPLDVALLSEFSPHSPLKTVDRLSAIGLLGAWADFRQEGEDSWKKYDSISAEQLFLSKAGVTPTLYRELISPLLHVLPMTPGYDCSAAAALSCFHVFALQTKGAFDVRWCRGTISESIFNPWVQHLTERGNVNIFGSSKVTSIITIEQKKKNGTNGDDNTRYCVEINGGEKRLYFDAIIFAVGATAMKQLSQKCPPSLQHIAQSKEWHKLRGVTCVAVRLFLKPSATITSGLSGGMYNSTQLVPEAARAMQDSPVIVCGPRVLPELAETGFCIYDLQRLHNEFAVDNNKKNESVAVLEVDFFRADSIANQESNQQVAKLALRAVSSALGIKPLDDSAIVDVSVVRARNAVSHFCIDSASSSPPVKLSKGMYCCGDWIDRTGHASWSTEKGVVTARQAVGSLSQDFGLTSCDTNVIPAASDTAQLSALRKAAQNIEKLPMMDNMGKIPMAPWMMR